MRTTQKFFWALVVSVLFTACAKTNITAIWKDEAYQGYPARIMVVGITSESATRRFLEDEFVKALKDHETDAIPSYPVVPDQSLADKGAIDGKAKEIGADAILITKPVSKTMDTESLFSTYAYMNKYIDTDTTIYDMKSGKQIWNASSETWGDENLSEKARMRSIVNVIIKRLSKQKLIKPGHAASNNKSD